MENECACDKKKYFANEIKYVHECTVSILTTSFVVIYRREMPDMYLNCFMSGNFCILGHDPSPTRDLEGFTLV